MRGQNVHKFTSFFFSSSESVNANSSWCPIIIDSLSDDILASNKLHSEPTCVEGLGAEVNKDAATLRHPARRHVVLLLSTVIATRNFED